MGWEVRRRGGPYYYRSVREGDRVRKEYLGGGVLGLLAARLDEAERQQRRRQASLWEAERQRLERSAAFLQELTEASEILVRAHLIASGHHQRKGEWRRARERHGA